MEKYVEAMAKLNKHLYQIGDTTGLRLLGDVIKARLEETTKELDKTRKRLKELQRD